MAEATRREAWEHFTVRFAAWRIDLPAHQSEILERMQLNPNIRAEDVWALIELFAFVINVERQKAQTVASEVALILARLPKPNEC